jgi:NTP pyrophosphatase (non-canonical NTP hydrolase)
MRISDLIAEAHACARGKGFWDKEREFGSLIALVHAELLKALEAHRRGEGFDRIGNELADAVLRIADICGAYRINLEECLKVKMIKNLARRPMHGKLY